MVFAVTQSSPSRSSDKFIVRLPDGMRDQLAAAAKANRRSMNAELIIHLERGLTAPTPSPQTDSPVQPTETAYA